MKQDTKKIIQLPQSKEKAKILYIDETSYEDDTYWVHYEIKGSLGYEIIEGDKIELYKVGSEILVDHKPKVTVCSDSLQNLLDECRGSDNEMWFVEKDEMTEDEVLKIQEEVTRLDDEYENLELWECITFGEDGAAITVYGGSCTKFLF